MSTSRFVSTARITLCSLVITLVTVGGDRARSQGQAPPPFRFHLMEATIADVHRAIREGQILPHKALLSFHGAIGSNVYNDRAGIHCRDVVDAVKVLDALKSPHRDERGRWVSLERSGSS
jgi:hypothetical protein